MSLTLAIATSALSALPEGEMQPGLFSSLPDGLIEGAALCLTRCGALLLTAPLIGTGSQVSGYKVALVTSVSIVLYMAQGMPLVETTSAVHFGLLLLREMLLGFGLAFILHLTLLGIRIGSEMVGNEMAFTMASASDPASGEALPLISKMNETLFFLALLAVDGHQWLIRALAESYERAPVGTLDFGGDLSAVILRLFSEFFASGIAFAAPVLVLLMMISVLIGLIARAVPQVNVLEMGFSLRVGGGLLALCLLSPTLSTAMTSLLEQLMAGLEAGLDAIEV
ncbi:flagellar biosynthesis protein FliR [Planctomycetes bacterium Poly30]|uniref:Flagellar biosynthesis protein FliR n=1 Tax=Saltatorellus ferox TaxID=2528018 RepID=A0A518ELQ3_9BACT|nr:flagellar biosynthesis protein FliR [Planctomycetes bacterium Poly30]